MPRDDAIAVSLVWLAIAAHVAAGVIAWRRPGGGAVRLVPLLNLVMGACIVAYWVPRWYRALFRGLVWEASDQLFPLYGVALCVLAGLTLRGGGRWPGMAPHWVAFGVDGLALLAAAAFFALFRMDRLF